MTTSMACCPPPFVRSRFRIVRWMLVCLVVWSYAPPAQAQQDPYGSVDALSLNMISGWAVDPDFVNCSLTIHVLVEYQHPGSASDFVVLAAGTADVYRPDTAGNHFHGFNIPFDRPLPGTHIIRVYAFNADSSCNLALPLSNSLVGSPRTYENPAVAKETGVIAFGADHICPGKPLRLDLLVYDAGPDARLHNRGYTNISTSNPPVHQAYIAFKHPLPVGDTTPIVLRVTKRVKVDGQCTDAFMDWNSPANYFDSTPTPIQPDETFRPLTAGSSGETGITLETANYEVRMDRNGGAIYEFYNKRMDGGDENAIHAHMGAAAQVAYHASATYAGLGIAGCNGQEQWNPNQSGAACQDPVTTPAKPLTPQLDEIDRGGYQPGSGLTVTCHYAGQSDQPFHAGSPCSSTNRTGLTFSGTGADSTFRLMNWDYNSAVYPGPYNVEDTGGFWQRVDASHADYLVVHGKLLDATNSHTQPNAALEAPGVFLTNRYRTFYVPTQSISGVSPVPVGWTECRDTGWVTAENTFPAQELGQTVPNRYITIAWFYENDSLFENYTAGSSCEGHKIRTDISEDTVWSNVRLGAIPHLKLMANTPVEFWYVIFPYHYNDTVTVPGAGSMTVKDAIAYLKAHHPQ